jgi:hypothetical protein
MSQEFIGQYEQNAPRTLETLLREINTPQSWDWHLHVARSSV